ncbi:MAG: effector-associated domain EAD1-containing protein [Chloroflexota bacterium]
MAKLPQNIREQYSFALRDAFPEFGDLVRLYRMTFDQNLAEVCSSTLPLNQMVEKILDISESRDACERLVAVAVENNPSNKALQSLWEEINRKQAPTQETLPEETNACEQVIGFVNRKKELETIFLIPGQISRYWVIDAPAGYGKSQLLAEVEKRYQQNNWLTVKIAFPRKMDRIPKEQPELLLIDLVAKPILRQLHDGRDEIAVDATQAPEEIGMEISTAVLMAAQKAEAPHLRGVAIIVDNFENCPDVEVLGFVELISGIFTGLSNNNDFFKSRHLRVFVSGRYARNKIKNARDQIMMADISLAPFTFEVIADTIQEFAISKGISGGLNQATDIAAYLMYITGGHPGFTAEILNQLALEHFTRGVRPLVRNCHHYQANFTQRFYNQLIQESPKLKEHQLIDILVSLSPFRKYDRWFFLKELKERKFLPGDLDEEEIEKSLLSTYLVDRQSGFLHDGIYRYLLGVWLRIQQPVLYADLCNAGIEIYRKQINSGGDIRRIEKWAIEFIYLNIVQNYHVQKITGNALVKQTKENMSWVIGELAGMKSNLSEADIEIMREDFINGLNDDAELKFLYNFGTAKDNHFEIRSFESLIAFAKNEFDRIL